MPGFVGGRRGSMLLVGVSFISVSCSVGHIGAPTEPRERGGEKALPEPEEVDASGEVHSDAGTCANGDGGPDCPCAEDSDGDGKRDCEDECPLAANASLVDWYPDCDGDGQASITPVQSCSADPPTSACRDGQAPNGGWLQGPGSDCNDEDRSATEERDYYPDCDADGAARSVAIRACGILGASAAFDCDDGKDPDGGFWSVQGSDCDDEDSRAAKLISWYADCDGDRVGTSMPVLSCGTRFLNGSPCTDGKAPDGGFLASAGTDCNDEDSAAAKVTDWFADCDGDGVARSAAIPACGTAGANAAFECADGTSPDGGFLAKQGSDCNDDDRNASVIGDWYPDCDGDNVRSTAAVRACGLRGAEASFSCQDGQDPDGSFGLVRGTDCNDEDRDATALSNWYPDCDGDLRYATSATRACGLGGARSAFNCRDGADPDGGFSATPGDDCDDENGTTAKVTDWYADCDGDGEPTNAPTPSCGTPAATLTKCRDGQLPDGGYDALAGVDCDDEQANNPCACGYHDDDGDGTCALRAPRSCLEIKQRDALARDGDYSIDPDGNASTPEVLVSCDMSAGGWTVIARDAFSAGDALGWQAADGSPSPVNTSACATVYSPFLGGPDLFGTGAQTMKTFALLGIPHTELSVNLDYLVLDSWDTEDALVYVDSVERFRATYAFATTASDICGGGWSDLGSQPVSAVFGHSQDTATVLISSSIDSPANDESFGVDNVIIRVR